MFSTYWPKFKCKSMLFLGGLILCLSVVPWVTTSAADANANPEAKATGFVERMPDASLVGEWSVDGTTYVAGPRTQFRQNNGPLMNGACVEINYSGNSMPYSINQIRTHNVEKCIDAASESGNDDANNEDAEDGDADNESSDSADDGDEDDDDADEDSDDEAEPSGPDDGGTSTMPALKVYGIIGMLPEGTDYVGTWTVDDIEYSVTAETKLEQEHGRFEVDSCVQIKYAVGEDEQRTAIEIETQSEHKCDRDATAPRGHGILFGIVQSFPEDLVGEWNVGGMSFTADEVTTFKTKKKVDFKVGVIVKVRFMVEPDDTYRAVAIESKFRHASYGGDDETDVDEDGDVDDDDGLRGHAFGELEMFPVDLIGEWVVSGITYTTTSETNYIQSKGVFTDGGSVRINYMVDDAGNRVAKVIKSTKGRKLGVMKLIGYLNTRPANGFTGEWVIDGITVETDLETGYDEGNGLVAQQAYIEVEYTLNPAGKRRVLKITVHVPPEAGENDSSGLITEIDDDSDVQAASYSNSETWSIDGQSYIVTDATEIDESAGELGVGSRVSVNSYTAEDGSEVATQIRARNVIPILYIPILQ